MKTIDSNNVTTFDVDNTLIMWDDAGQIDIEYGKKNMNYREHKFHPTFLRHCKQRGDFIIVWSQNGYEWAEKVVKKLELEDYVDVVMSKPIRHIDDKTDPAAIIGTHIYIHENHKEDNE